MHKSVMGGTRIQKEPLKGEGSKITKEMENSQGVSGFA